MRGKPTEPPDLEQYSDVPLFNTKAVVQQTGIAAPTLRAWERRYTILSPKRTQNDYRLYSERDIALLRWLKERVDAGVSISQAIALLRHLTEEQHQRQQLQQKDSRLEGTTPFQVSGATPAVGEQEPIEGDEQGVQEKTKQAASPPVLQHPQELDTKGMLNHFPAMYTLRLVQERLLETFTMLDEVTASQLMASMLAVYSIEQICRDLITPTLWEIGQRWEQGLITVAIEHFASAFFRGLLTNLFHATPSSETSPLVITCCAPGEAHEVAPLMISLLLRRAGLRVAYLGQSIETAGLLQTIRQVTPVLICVSVTLLSSLEGLIELGQKLQEMPPPRPTLVFGGQVFKQEPALIAQVPGIYLDGDMQSVIAQIRRMAFQQVEDNSLGLN
jgi:MerR family transcriptional regulator, light-induced transcriptional regulator